MISQLKNIYLKQGYAIIPNIYKKDFEKFIYPTQHLSIYNIPHLHNPHTHGTYMKIPPYILSFDCNENNIAQCEITLVDSKEIKNTMSSDLRILYSRIPFKWSQYYQYYNAPIIDTSNNLFRFNEYDLSKNQNAFISKIKNIISNCEHTNINLTSENTIFINNHRILHSKINYTYNYDFSLPNTFIQLY